MEFKIVSTGHGVGIHEGFCISERVKYGFQCFYLFGQLSLLAVPGREFRDLIDHHRQLVVDDNEEPGDDRVGGSLTGNTAFQFPKKHHLHIFRFHI